MCTKLNKLILLFSFVISATTLAQIRLPKLISDGMVLQRNADVKIWGWAVHREKISLSFIGSTYNTTANDSGEWEITLSNLKAGGPYTMTISASDTVIIHDVVIGEVWLCSGQSNMELPMKRVSWNYPGEIEHSENKFLRQFYVPQRYNFNQPENNLPYGLWKAASPENTPDFSAVAYFFGKYLYEKYNVPIGLINSSLGGSPVESWISADSLKRFAKYYRQAEMFRDSMLIKKIETADRARIDAWYAELWKADQGNKDPQHPWHDPSFNASDWDSMNVPGYWANETKLGWINGVVWFRKTVNIPPSMLNTPAKLILGRIVDADSAYINGRFVGTVSYQYPPRRYDIPAGVLKTGENSVVVRVISNAGKGGFVPDKLYAIVAGNDTVSIAGKWRYHLGAEMPPLAGQTFVRWMPLGLYNAMVAPLLNYHIKGVIWYQGESNAGRPFEYRELFSTLIRDWRARWGEGDFPFLFVQLPNFMEAKSQPSESGWALLREAQLQTLFLPNTGMAVTIDIGEWNDIHPLNKQDVGNRLALAAEKIAYGEDNVVDSGPVYQAMRTKGNKVELTFTNIGSGLMVKGKELRSFAIAGADKKFVWAKAKIVDKKVVVWSNSIRRPVAVRYAWADDPEGANLYNSEGLPASPFRTDEWK
ncbi:MAG: sialate O-acetylesterase [Bacteroidota bacterium]|nr:sialate O-acetylesterase [Bacteroidota bacterium]